MDQSAADSLEMSKVSKVVNTSHKEELEKLTIDMIAYFKIKNDPSHMLHVFNKIRSQLKINGIVKMKDGKIFIEETHSP